MTLAVYGDFTDTLSYVASLRVDALRTSGTPVEWRAVTEQDARITTSTPLGTEDAMIHGRSHLRADLGQGYAVAIGGGPVTTDAWRLIRQWRTGFAGVEQEELPVVTDGVLVLSGFAAVEHLSELVGDQRIPETRENPYALPPLSVSAQRRWAERPGLRPGWWES